MAARRRAKAKVVPDPPREARKVYVETSVWGMTLQNQPRALREPTQQFLRLCALGLFEPYISAVVLREIAHAKGAAKSRMLRQIDALAPVHLEASEASEELAEAFLRAGVVPAKKPDDARHVAIATVAGLDLVVSWNHRHLASGTCLTRLNRLAGYQQVLLIHTPFEVMQ